MVQGGKLGLKLAARGQRRIKADEAAYGCRMRRFTVGPELFGFLISGAEAREFDGGFAIGSKSVGHETRQVCDEVRLGEQRDEEAGCLLTRRSEEKFNGFSDR